MRELTWLGIADTYSADDIWGVGIVSMGVPTGRHTLRVEVLGGEHKYSTGTLVHIDGVRVR